MRRGAEQDGLGGTGSGGVDLREVEAEQVDAGQVDGQGTEEGRGALEVRPDRAAARRGDAGMATAEYAIATLAACGFAALLVSILRGGEVQEMLLDVVRRALGSV